MSNLNGGDKRSEELKAYVDRQTGKIKDCFVRPSDCSFNGLCGGVFHLRDTINNEKDDLKLTCCDCPVRQDDGIDDYWKRIIELEKRFNYNLR